MTAPASMDEMILELDCQTQTSALHLMLETLVLVIVEEVWWLSIEKVVSRWLESYHLGSDATQQLMVRKYWNCNRNYQNISGEKLPGVYSRISESLDWIQEVISDGKCWVVLLYLINDNFITNIELINPTPSPTSYIHICSIRWTFFFPFLISYFTTWFIKQHWSNLHSHHENRNRSCSDCS